MLQIDGHKEKLNGCQKFPPKGTKFLTVLGVSFIRPSAGPASDSLQTKAKS